MDLKYILIRIKTVGLTKLVKIVMYKLALFVVLKSEEFSLFFRRTHTSPVFISDDLVKQNAEFFHKFRHYFNLVTPQAKNDIVHKAQDIIKGKVFLWTTECNIRNDEWLNDPVHKKEWSSTDFFYHSKIDIEGYGDVKFVLELNKFYHLVTLAQAYYYTSDNRYINEINTSLQNWIKTVKYQRSVVWRIMLDLAFRSINLIFISILCYNDASFQKETFPMILGILKDNERQIRKYSSSRWHRFHYGANHDIGEMVGLIVLQIFLSQFNKKKYDKEIKEEISYLNECLNHIITKEGVYLEQSANYSRLVAEFLVLLDVCARFIPNKIFDKNYNPEYLNRLSLYLERISCNGVLPDFGDGDNAKVLSLINDKFNTVDATLLYAGKRFSKHKKDKKKNLYCPQSGQIAWKSQDENGISLFLRCGIHGYYPKGASVHSHNDQLALLFSAKGTPVFIDKGTYLYNSGSQIRNADRSAQFHNTVYIEKIEQAPFLNKWAYQNYPESKILQVKDNINEFFFQGQCSYSGVIHTRTLEYKESHLIINDLISNRSGITKNAESNFILDETIIPVRHNENTVELYHHQQKIASVISSENIIVNDVEYSLVYGEKRTTKRISIRFEVHQEKKINIWIEL